MSDQELPENLEQTPQVGPVNNDLNPDPAIEATGTTLGPEEYKTFSQWGSENAQGDELGDMLGYTNYVREEHIKKNKYSEKMEAELQQAVYTQALNKQLINEEDGLEANAEKLFGAPKQSPDAQRTLITKNSQSFITAVAANNLDQLPEGTDPSQVWEDMVTFNAKKKAFAKDPETNSKNPEIVADLAYYEEKTDAYLASGIFNKVAPQALLDGSVMAARIYDEDGNSSVRLGKAAEGKSPLEIIKGSAEYGVVLQDATEIQKQLETQNGFQFPKYDIDRKKEINGSLNEVINTDKSSGKKYNRLRNLFKAYDKALSEDDPSNVDRLDNLIKQESDSLYVTATSLDPSLDNLDIDQEEFRLIIGETLQNDINFSNGFVLQDDPNKMGANVKNYGYGAGQVHSSLITNPKKFEESLAANKDITEEQKEYMRSQREAQSAAVFDERSMLLSEGPDSEEWLGALQVGRANGEQDYKILEKFLEADEGYSEYLDRAANIFESIHGGATMLLTGPLAMLDVGWARDHVIGIQAQNAARRERARLYGMEYGMKQDIAETIAPLLTDMAVTAATAGAGATLLVAKQAAKQGVKMTTKGLMHGVARSLTMKQPFKEMGKKNSGDLIDSLYDQKFITKPADATQRQGAMDAFSGYADAMSNKFVSMPAVAAPAFIRSSGATYASAYQILGEDDPSMSHEEKHSKSLGAGMWAGFATVSIMGAFGAMGKTALEDAFIRGMTKKESLQIVGRLTNLAKKVKLDSGDAQKIWASAVTKTQSQMIKGSGKFKGQKNWATEAFDGFLSEAVEEGLDEVANSYITDAYTGRDSGMGRWESAWNAFLIGGTLGSGVGLARKLGSKSSARVRAVQSQRNEEAKFKSSLVSNLEEKGAPVTAALVDQIVTKSIRSDKTAAAVEQITVELDSNFNPVVLNPQPVAPEAEPVTEPTAEGGAPVTEAAAEGEAPVTEPTAEGEAPVTEAAAEGEAPAQIVDTPTAGPQLKQTKAAQAKAAEQAQAEKNPIAENLKRDVVAVEASLRAAPQEVILPESDAAPLDQEQFENVSQLLESFDTSQTSIFDQLVSATESGTVRELRVATAIQDGALSLEGTEIVGEIPAANNPERTDEGNRKNIALLIKDGKVPTQQWSREDADAEALRKSDADYSLDGDNYVVGVRDPDTKTWVGTPPISVEADTLNVELDDAEGSSVEELENYRAEQQEAREAPQQKSLDVAPILGSMPEDTKTLVQDELGLIPTEVEGPFGIPQTQLSNADVDALVPTTNSQVVAAQEDGIDLEDINEQQQITFAQEERILPEETEPPKSTTPILTKQYAGEYKVESGGETFLVKRRISAVDMKPKGWLIFSTGESLEATDNNNWAREFDTRKEALQAIEEVQVEALRKPNQPLQAAVRKEVVDSQADNDALVELVSAGFPQRISSKTPAGFKVSNRKEKGYYATVSNNAAQQIYNTWPVTKNYKQPPSGGKFSGRKQSHYNPYTGETAEKTVKGFVDSAGNGVFNNDPVLANEFLEQKVPLFVDAPTLDQIRNKQFKLNPAIQVDYETGEVFNVISPSNLISGQKQGVGAGNAQTVLNTQPNRDTYMHVAQAANMFNTGLRETVMDINMIPLANGNSQRADIDRSDFTVGNYIDAVNQFISDGLSTTSDQTETAKTLERVFNQRGRLEPQYMEEAANAFRADAMFLSNVFGVRQQILSSQVGQNLLQETLDPKTGNPTGKYEMLVDNATNRAKLMKEFIRFTKISNEPTSSQLDSLMQVIAPMTAKGKTPTDVATRFILDTVVNNTDFVDGQMPPMINLINKAADRYRKQQKSRSDAEATKAAEALYYEGKQAQAEDGSVVMEDENADVIRWSKQAETADIGTPRPTAVSPDRAKLYETLDKAALNISSVLSDPANKDLREAFNDMALVAVGDSELGRQRVSEMDVDSLVNVFSEWAIAGNQRPRVRKFLKTLEDGKSPAATTLRKSFKLMALSSRSVSGDPSQDVEYVETVREALETSMGTPYTAQDARDYIRAVDGQVRTLWSRSRITKAQQKIARASNASEIERLGLVSGDPESVINALQLIAETGTTYHKLVAELLLENPSLIRSVKFTIGDMDMAIAGMQSTMVDGSLEVFLNLNGHNGRGLTNVLLEEYLHATLTKTLAMPTESMTPAQQQAVARLKNLMNEIRESAIAKGYRPNSAIMDSLVNLDEFVSGILLSPDLQKEIKGLSPDGQSFFQRIAEAIMKFFRKGVTTKEASQYANAIADVIDLAQSTVSVSDPRLKVRAKRLAQRVTAELKISEQRSTDAGVLYTSIGEPRPEPAQMTPEEKVIAKSQKDLQDIQDNLTEADVDAEGNVYDRETEEAKRKGKALLQVARDLVPPEVPFRIDNTTSAAAEFVGGEVTINLAFLMDLTSKIGLTNSKLVVAKVISHELSHVAAFNIIPQAEIDAMAEALTPSMYDSIIDSYYADRPSEAAAAKALLRGTDLDAQGQADLLDMKARLTEEHLRMRMEKLTTGYTTEEDWAFYRTNPSLMKTLFRYVSAYFRRMAEMRRFNRELNNGSPNKVIDLALDNLILELRAIKAGYRIQETTAHFDPANPDGNFAILNEIADEGMLDPESFTDNSVALQAAITLPPDFVAKVSDEHDDLRAGTAKLGTKAVPKDTPQDSNISGELVSDSLLAKQMAKMNYAHLPASIRRKRNPQAKRKALIDWVVGNLKHLHDAFPEDLRSRATHWYDGARILADRFADQYGYKPEQAAGVIAALSPQRDWFMNIAQAEQVMDVYSNHQDTKLEGADIEATMQRMIESASPAASVLKGKSPSEQKAIVDKYQANRRIIFDAIRGKSVRELSANRTLQGWAVRMLSQNYHGLQYKALSPEGETGHVMLTAKGNPANLTWGGVEHIVKALHILDGDPISDYLGNAHKVRSFYNNIIAPNSPLGDVTMDTHAIAAAHLMPFGGSAPEVQHNLGTAINKSPATGVDGVYHIYADAYRIAAADLGLLPRQLQSITWEAIRMVHSADAKRNKNYIAAQKKLWKNEDHEQARSEITAGLKDLVPAWAGFGANSRASDISESIQQTGGADVTGRGVSVRDGGLQSAIGNPRLHGRRTNSGGTTLYRAGEPSSSPAQAQDRGLLELTAQDFSSIGQANKNSHKFGTSVDVYEPNDYDGYELIMVEKNGATATASVSPTGEVGSVTKSPDATAEMVMEVFAAAVDTGKVKWLNGFDTVLPSIYADLGFEVVGRVPFDPTYKPEGWDFTTYKKFNNGQPDVVFMKYTGLPNEYAKGSGKDLGSYEAAEAATLAEADRPAKVAQQRRNPNGLQAAIGPTQYDEDFMEEAEMSGKMYAFVEDMPNSVRSALERNDYLGYSSASEALANIASERDWELGTELNTPSDQGIINRYINKLYGQTAEDVRWRRNNYGLQSAIAPSKAFSQDKLNYSGFIDQLELPFYSTGGYNAPSNKFKQTFLGMVDPRVKRILERADFFNKAAEQIGEGFKIKFDKQIKKAFGKNGPDAESAILINNAIGRSAVLTKEQRDTIEDEYEQELKVIEEFDYETEADKQIDLKIVEDNKHSKIITLKTAAAKTIVDEQIKAIADLEKISPDLARLITSLRTELIEPIQEHLKELYNLSDTMVAHFDVQQGIYLTTTYKMFTDSGYSQRMEQDPEYEILKEAADKMFVEQEMETRIKAMETAAEENGEIFNEQEARIMVQADLDSADPDTLRTFGQQQTFEFLAKYERVGKNDIVTDEDAAVLEDNLKEKKDFAPELKALLGEVGTESGTIDNLVLTFMTVSKMAARQRMLQSLAAMGKSEGFMMSAKDLKAAKAEDPDTYKNWRPVISGDNISAYNPLRGMFAPADVVSGLTAEFESRLNNEDTRPEAQVLAVVTGTVRQAAGWAMAVKTLGSFGFYIRNMASNMLFFGPAQGFYNMGSMMAKWKYIGEEMIDPNRLNGYMSELTSLGIIKNEIRSTMLEEMIKGKVSFTDVLAAHSKTIKAADKLIGKPAEAAYALATRMAGAVDGFYKIAYYEHELKILRKAKAKSKEGESFFTKSDNDLKQMASNNILMTAQSASQAPPIIKEFATHGAAALVAPFVRFKAEVPRIVYNTYKLSAQERKSDSSVIRNRGRLRFFGMTSVGVGVSGFAPAMLAMLSGTDDDDMEDFQRYTAPSYLRSHTFWSLPKGAIPEWLGGSKEYYQSIDLTYINPFAILMDPILRSIGAAADGDAVGVATKLIGGLFGDQYLDTQILTQSLLSAMHNVDPTTGKPIIEEISDKGWDRVIKRASFVLAEAYEPDVLKRALKAIELANSEDDYTDPDYTVKQILIGAVRPIKIHTIIPERQLTSYLYPARNEYSNVRQRKNEMRTRRPMAGGRVIDILNAEQEDRTAIDNMTMRMMRGAKKFGMTNQQIYETLRATNHPKRKAHMLMHGKQDRIAFTPDFGKNLLKNTTSKEERDMKLRRYREGIQWISEQPQIRTLDEEPIYKPE